MSDSQIKQLTNEAKALAREARATHRARITESKRTLAALEEMKALIEVQITTARLILENAERDSRDLETQLGASQ